MTIRAKRPPNSCADCWAPIDQDDLNVEAFEATGELICRECWEGPIDDGEDMPAEHGTYHTRNGSVVG